MALYFVLLTGTAYTQAVCVCPAVTQCTPCSGSIVGLTLKYTGNFTVFVAVFDNASLVFSQMLSPGEVFTVNGSTNGKFASNEVYLFVNAFFNTSIVVTCALAFDPETQHGLFTIKSALSQGGPLCCTSNDADIDPPLISGCPANIDVVVTAQCPTSVSWSVPQAEDCNLISFTSNKSPGALFPVGNTTVTYTATDFSNNTSTCSFTVTVRDMIPPVATTNCPVSISANADGNCKAKVTWTQPTFTDNCSTVTLTSSHTSGSTFSLGTTEVTYTAKDGSGNTTLCKFNVIVKDLTGPAVAACPNDRKVNADQSCQSTVTWNNPVFNDKCSSVTVESTHLPGDVFPVGLTEVIYTGVDEAGNSTQCKFNVVVNDGVLPVISGCPEDILLITKNPTGQVNATWGPVTATDDCNLSTETASHESGDLFPVGSTTVTHTAIDFSGNTVTCTFDVTVLYEGTILEIVQVVTPDGNGINDEWMIGNIEKYETNRVIIVDRWGTVVYTANGYDNQSTVWNGQNRNGNVVPTGTYFYTISVELGPSVVEKQGFIELVR